MSTRIPRPRAAVRTPALSPRKPATQERSRATVQALVEATARVLVREGYERATTNRIAEEAGVSVGSLYQYFPTKESLVAAVIEDHKGETLRLLRAALARAQQMTLEAGLRELVTVAIRAHLVDPQLHAILSEQIPRNGRLAEVEAFDREAQALVRDFLESHRAELRDVDLDLATFVCVSSVESLTHGAVLRHKALITRTRREVFVDEVTRLVTRYLRP
jgi:AcrR family transcriptional regulator